MAGQSDVKFDIARLSEALNNLQKSLECPICLELMTQPMKTRCGHSFCQACIRKVLQKKAAHCPACKEALSRRNVSKDDHLEAYIAKFRQLVIAVQMDTHVDVLSYLKQPRDTKESCTYSDTGEFRDSNSRRSSRELSKSTRDFSSKSSRRINAPSTSRGAAAIDRDNPRQRNTYSLGEKSIEFAGLSGVLPLPADENDDAFRSTDIKIRTWLHTLPSDLPMNTSVGIDTTQPLDVIADADEKESSFTLSDCVDKTHRNKTDKSHARTRRVGQPPADCTAHIDDTSQVDEEAETRQLGKVGKIDSAPSGLRYNASHARVRAKVTNKRKRNSTKASDEQEEIPGDDSRRSSSLTTTNRQPLQSNALDLSTLNRPNTSAGSDRQYSADTDWSRVIELGKEMRPKRRKLKKLDVERKKVSPRIIENVALTPHSKITLIEDTACHTSRKETSVSNLLDESKSREQADKDLSSAKFSPETSGETKSREFDTSLANRSTMDSSSYITLEEGRQVRIINLNDDQVSHIIGCNRVEKTPPRIRAKNQRGENASVAKCRNDSPHRLTVLTPDKLNQLVDEEKISRAVARTPAGKHESLLLAGDRTPGPRMNSSAQKTSEKISSSELSSPIYGRLSLRRKVIIGDHKSVDLSLKQLASDKSPINRHVEDTSDHSDDSSPEDHALSHRLTTARRDLTSQILGDQVPMRLNRDSVSSKKPIEIKNNTNVSVKSSGSSTKSKRTENERCDELPVKFMKLGTLIRRRNVKYYYLGPTRREQSFPAEVRVAPVCTCNNWNYNMQRSDSEHSNDITPIKNVRSVESNLKDAQQSSIHKVSDVSTSRKTIDAHSSRKEITADPARAIERSSNLTDQSTKSVREKCQMSAAISHKKSYVDNNTGRNAQKLPHSFPGTTNAIKLLSPDKDSQLKYLAIDSPMSERRRLMGSTRRQFEHDKSATKEYNFSEAKSSCSATPGTQEPTPESSEFIFRVMSEKRKKRIKHIGDEEQFMDKSVDKLDNSISSDDDDQCTITLDNYKRLAGKLDESKKHRLSTSHDQNDEAIVSDSSKRDERAKKYKRIMPIYSDTESESPTHDVRNQKRHKTDDHRDQQNASIASAPKEKRLLEQDMDEDLRIQNIVRRWSNEHNASQNRLMRESGIQRCSPKEKPTSRRASSSAASFEAEKHDRTNEKNPGTTESYVFESNSIFGMEHVDNITQQIWSNRSQTSQKIADPSNEDIVNKVLEIDRSAPRSSGTASQREKNSREHLLHDNFDEMIANVELPQSEDVVSQAKQPARSLHRTLTQQRLSKCLAVTNEPCNTTRESPITISSTSDDIFECDGFSKKSRVTLPQNIVSRQRDKENIASHDEKRTRDYTRRNRKDMETIDLENIASHDEKRPRDYTRRNRKDVETTIDLDKDDSRGRAASKHSASREKEPSFDRVDANEYFRTDKERGVSAGSADRLCIDDSAMKARGATAASDASKSNSFEDDTLMNVTQHQAQLRIFEEDLFGIPATRAKATKLASRDDPCREKQGTPEKRKQTARDRKALGEHSAEEDDVVENTPERKMKNSGNNVTAIKSRKNIATLYFSPISNQPADRTPSTSNISHKKDTPKSNENTPMNRLKTLPLYQSTPKVVHAPATTIKHPDATASKKTEPTASGSTSSAWQVDSKVLVDACRQPDRQKLCFVCSGLTSAQIRLVKKFAEERNVNCVDQFDPSVTHVIVNTIGKDNVTKSTLKYLQGMAYRKWIVSYGWIEDCDKERELLDEVPYEATMDYDGVNRTAARNSRLRHKGLFEGFTFLCVGPYTNVTLRQYQDLLLATGATVVDSLEALAKARGLRGIVIQENTHDDKTITHWYLTAKAAPIIVDWIVECIGQYKLFDLAPYIQCCPLEDIYAIGYSREIMGEEEYSDDYL